LGNSRVIQRRQALLSSLPVAVGGIRLAHQENVFISVPCVQTSRTGLDKDDGVYNPSVIKPGYQSQDKAEKKQTTG
jgi:hypothetical protein